MVVSSVAEQSKACQKHQSVDANPDPPTFFCIPHQRTFSLVWNISRFVVISNMTVKYTLFDNTRLYKIELTSSIILNWWHWPVYACIESFTDLVSLLSDIWLLCLLFKINTMINIVCGTSMPAKNYTWLNMIGDWSDKRITLIVCWHTSNIKHQTATDHNII